MYAILQKRISQSFENVKIFNMLKLVP